MTTDAQRTPGNFYRVDFIPFDVVIDRAAIYIDDLRRTRHADHFHILRATRAPHFVTENERRLRRSYDSICRHNLWGVTPPYSESQ